MGMFCFCLPPMLFLLFFCFRNQTQEIRKFCPCLFHIICKSPFTKMKKQMKFLRSHALRRSQILWFYKNEFIN